jgi:hypothetical protein
MSDFQQVLSCAVDLENKDIFLYRIQREKRIIYVLVRDKDILPDDCLIHSINILGGLRNVPKFNDNDWTTLTVRKNKSTGQVESVKDSWPPHNLSTRQRRLCGGKLFDILQLKHVKTIKDRVSRVVLMKPDEGFNKTMILKIAKFKHEVKYLEQEVVIYYRMARRGMMARPRFLGYAYEEHDDRVVGFLLEDTYGRPAEIGDLEACEKAVQELHDNDILHNDLNRFNFLVSDEKVRILDYETAVNVGRCAEDPMIISMKTAEMNGLAEKLLSANPDPPRPAWGKWEESYQDEGQS